MAEKVHCVPLVALGRHHHWSRDGHDKLVKIGFPVWGIQDMWIGKWLRLWTIPDNQLKVVITYLYQVYLSNLPQRYMDLQMHLGIFKLGCFFTELMLTSHGNIIGKHLHPICQLLTLQYINSSRAFIIQPLNRGGCTHVSSGNIM